MIELSIDDPRWLQFAGAHPDAVAYHHPAWGKLIGDCYGYRAFVLAVEGDAGALRAGIPMIEVRGLLRGRRWVALPFTDALAPLAADASAATELMAGADAARVARGISQLEIRAPVEHVGAYQQSNSVVHLLDLGSDADALFSTFKKTQIRQPVAKAARSGITVRRATSPADLTETFYSLHLETRRRLGAPVQPRRYFRMLWERTIEPGLGFVLMADLDGAPVAAAVFLAWNGTVLYKYSAARRDALKLGPSISVLWEAIRWGCEHGYQSFDFGRTELEHEGLRRFKQGWGTREEPLVYTAFGGAPSTSTAVRGKRLRPLIQHLPPWFCRAVGELAYKYAA